MTYMPHKKNFFHLWKYSLFTAIPEFDDWKSSETRYKLLLTLHCLCSGGSHVHTIPRGRKFLAKNVFILMSHYRKSTWKTWPLQSSSINYPTRQLIVLNELLTLSLSHVIFVNTLGSRLARFPKCKTWNCTLL